MNLDWVTNFAGPLHVVTYESLCSSTERELNRTLGFLGVAVPKAVMDCALKRREGIYKRPKKQLDFDVFDANLKGYLRERMKAVYGHLEALGKSEGEVQ